MDVFKKIFNIAVVVIAVIMTFSIGLFVYYSFWGKDKLPSAVTSTYATTIIDPQTGEKRPVMEANYFENYNNTGYEVIELRFNCYSGISKQAVYSRGFQLVKNKDGKVIPYVYSEQSESNKTSNVFQYDSYDGASFETGHQYEWGDPMIIDIDGKTYAVKLDGNYSVTTKRFSFLKAVGHTFAGLFTGYNYSEKAYNFETNTYNYTFEDLLVKLKFIIKSCSNGTGDSVISLIDLGDFLHIYAVDDNGQISAEPLGVNTLQNSYFTVATHYDKRGLVWAKQSLFKSVAGDSSFNISGLDDGVDYWRAIAQVNLTEKDFVARYDSARDGYYYSLSIDKINELKNFGNVDININFTISNLSARVLGFDNYALYGLKINSLTIQSSLNCYFDLLDNCLKDCGITEIVTSRVTLNNSVNSGVTL